MHAEEVLILDETPALLDPSPHDPDLVLADLKSFVGL
jgi:hypothetical protein